MIAVAEESLELADAADNSFTTEEPETTGTSVACEGSSFPSLPTTILEKIIRRERSNLRTRPGEEAPSKGLVAHAIEEVHWADGGLRASDSAQKDPPEGRSISRHKRTCIPHAQVHSVGRSVVTWPLLACTHPRATYVFFGTAALVIHWHGAVQRYSSRQETRLPTTAKLGAIPFQPGTPPFPEFPPSGVLQISNPPPRPDPLPPSISEASARLPLFSSPEIGGPEPHFVFQGGIRIGPLIQISPWLVPISPVLALCQMMGIEIHSQAWLEFFLPVQTMIRCPLRLVPRPALHAGGSPGQ
ncbi:hypothetical protein BJY00DRAFT_27588 [Aspergillus carlsbadensis]|nr:hypothetical protein BJY00DRAFT_27588 [Aspergillus carlsbadensis]